MSVFPKLVWNIIANNLSVTEYLELRLVCIQTSKSVPRRRELLLELAKKEVLSVTRMYQSIRTVCIYPNGFIKRIVLEKISKDRFSSVRVETFYCVTAIFHPAIALDGRICENNLEELAEHVCNVQVYGNPYNKDAQVLLKNDPEKFYSTLFSDL